MRLDCLGFFGDFKVMLWCFCHQRWRGRGFETSLSCKSQRLGGAEEAAKPKVWEKKKPCLCFQKNNVAVAGALFSC